MNYAMICRGVGSARIVIVYPVFYTPVYTMFSINHPMKPVK